LYPAKGGAKRREKRSMRGKNPKPAQPRLKSGKERAIALPLSPDSGYHSPFSVMWRNGIERMDERVGEGG
jgi:hypothetical protein